MPVFDEPVMPTEKDVLIAREFQRKIGDMRFERKESVGLEIEGQRVSIPAKIARLLIQALSRVAEGKTIALIPLDKEISPQQAAEILNVSRPFAAKLFDEGAIPSRRVGTHRRALTGDVLAYRERERKARLQVLDELAAEGQRLEMGV